MAMKPNFVKKKKRQRHGAAFWDSEYANPEHLALSDNPSEDLEKFTRWLDRGEYAGILTPEQPVTDFGCGNGRHLIFLARNFGMTGTGYDLSQAGIAQAKKLSAGLPIKYEARSIAGTYDLPDVSQSLALDMMTSHYLNAAERTVLRDEIHRVLKPGGFLFMKTFLRDGDLHSERLLKDAPGKEPGTYIHPVIGVPEFVYTEEELVAFLKERFVIHKIYRSHKHAFHGRARKRRTITIYAQKDPYL
jgi:SAM-dependent methyltransferase